MKILIIKPSSLGDVVHGLQVAAIIKSQLPSASIDWVIRDCFSEIIDASNIVDNKFLFYRGSGIVKFLKLIFEIRKNSYDYVLDMQGLARSGALTYFSKAKHKIGRYDAREFSRWAYDWQTKIPTNNIPHAINILMQFLPEIGLTSEFSHALSFNPTPSKKCNNITKNSQSEKYILIFPHSRRENKEWPYFGSLIESFEKIFPQLPIIIAGQKRFPLKGKHENIINLIGQTSINDLIFLIQNAALVIANDSAPAHIAAAVQTRILAIFGPTNSEKFGPYPINGKTNFALQSPNSNISTLKLESVLSLAEKIIREI